MGVNFSSVLFWQNDTLGNSFNKFWICFVGWIFSKMISLFLKKFFSKVFGRRSFLANKSCFKVVKNLPFSLFKFATG